MGASRHHAANQAPAAELIHRPARRQNDRHNPIYERERIPIDEALGRDRSLKHWYDAAATQVARRVVSIAAKRVDVRFEFADGTSWGPPRGSAPVFYVANPDDFYRRLGTDAKMAFGEAYVAGDWLAGHETDLTAPPVGLRTAAMSLRPCAIAKFSV
jgi:hypothetical protein